MKTTANHALPTNVPSWLGSAPQLTIMAFGFLVEKFDLFLVVGNIAGFTGLGAGTIVLALIRFCRTAIEIDSAQTLPSSVRVWT